MGWSNPPVPWDEFERRLSWRARSTDRDPPPAEVPPAGVPPAGVPPAEVPATNALPAAGGTAGQSAHPRQVTHLPRCTRAPQAGQVPWAELHCHSSYSFLDGASQPAELVAEAARRGIAALAITDHDGMYGAAQFAQAAARSEEETGVRIGTIFGAELSLDLAGDHDASSAGRLPGSSRASPGAGPRIPPCQPRGKNPRVPPGRSSRPRRPASTRAGPGP